ncbi:MAG: N-6 DNA methylase [Acidimicrobiaceae bacterium]|nr:N-6 DNA methylase [Acidimicrobiia bacterium]MCY4493408.1 N-6 DNA methylase [Acidimicrobiaceae bacterium]
MADEQHEMLGGDRIVPVELGWQSLLNRSGADLEAHCSDAMAALGAGEDMLGVIFHKARNRIQTPAKLEQLIKEFIDQHEWMSYDADLKGDAYEGLIEKTAQEVARGAGQHFTPRALINAIVDVMQPEPDDRICDPACGTGGFFLGAYRSIVERFPHLEPDQVAHLRPGACTDREIADLQARLRAMNMRFALASRAVRRSQSKLLQSRWQTGTVHGMTDAAVSPRTTYLYARPRALHGIARVFDFFGVYDSYNTSPTPQEADILAVLQDWLAVEEDAKHVMRASTFPGLE